jgi:hypothetical protein
MMENGLKGASIPFGGHFLKQSPHGFIQCGQFIHFIDVPQSTLAMYPI